MCLALCPSKEDDAGILGERPRRDPRVELFGVGDAACEDLRNRRRHPRRVGGPSRCHPPAARGRSARPPWFRPWQGSPPRPIARSSSQHQRHALVEAFIKERWRDLTNKRQSSASKNGRRRAQCRNWMTAAASYTGRCRCLSWPEARCRHVITPARLQFVTGLEETARPQRRLPGQTTLRPPRTNLCASVPFFSVLPCVVHVLH